MQAGAQALEFNAPLRVPRAEMLVAALRASRGSVVDLGCGRGSLLQRFAAADPDRIATGVDSDAGLIALANSQPTPSERLTFEVADATTWDSSTDVGAIIAIGVSHIFGGPGPMFERLGELCRNGVAIIGDAVWQSPPDAWCRETFGDLPNSAEELADLARAARWTVTSLDLASLDEWDEFEHGWIAGVRAVDTEEAHAFADERAAEYERYRGVLGFAWLTLAKDATV